MLTGKTKRFMMQQSHLRAHTRIKTTTRTLFRLDESANFALWEDEMREMFKERE